MITRTLKLLVSLVATVSLTGPAHAAPTYLSGHIFDVTFSGASVLIRLDTGLPDNCIGSPYGWIVIPETYKPMIAFVLAGWMRGDLGQINVTVYTDGLVNNYCRVNQFDPEN